MKFKHCGSPEATRRAFNKRFLLDLAEDWQQHGREVFKRVRRESPASYLKVCAMLVPKELKMEHSGGVAALYVRVSTDSQTLENQIRELRQVARRRGWDVVEVYRDAGISGAKGPCRKTAGFA